MERMDSEICWKQRPEQMRKKSRLVFPIGSRLVREYAKIYSERGVDRNDLLQRGNIELMEASRKFQPHKGFSFELYASWRIKKGMLELVQNQQFNLI